MEFNSDGLKGENIAITGATKGIGRATAIPLSYLGVNLLIGSRCEEDLQSLATSLRSRVTYKQLDVADENPVMAFLSEGEINLWKIDALINCGGCSSLNLFLELSREKFERIISFSLSGPFLISKYFANHIVKNRRGQIINISSISIAGNTMLEGDTVYSASKFALLELSKAMQLELRKKGVYATSVFPESTSTFFWKQIGNYPEQSKMIPQETIVKYMVSVLCQPEGAVVEEVTITPPLGIL